MSILTQEQQRFLDVADLRAITHTPQFNERVYIQSIANPSDIKEYAWESSSTLSDDGVNVIKVTSITTGRFHLVNVDAKFINKSTSLPSGINDGDTYFQDEVVTGTTQTSPNRFGGKVGGVWIELFQSWWKLFGTILKLNSGIPLIRDAVQVQTASGATQGAIGLHTAPSIRGYDTRESGLHFAEQPLVFGRTGLNSSTPLADPATANRTALVLASSFVSAFPTQFIEVKTGVAFSSSSGFWKLKIRVAAETAATSGHAVVEYTVHFLHAIGIGVLGDFAVSQNGYIAGAGIKTVPNIRIGDSGGMLAVYIDSMHNTYSFHHIEILDAGCEIYVPNTSPDSNWYRNWSIISVSALPATITAPIPVLNNFRNIYVNGTAYSSTGQTTFLPVPSMEKFKELLPEISDKTAIELAALLPRQLFKYIESGLRAYGWIVEEVQKAFETVRIDASEEEQALLDALLNDTVLMFDERKVFPEDWQPFEPKQADEQGEMTDEEYKEYLDKFQKEQDAALIDFTKRLEELSTEKLYTINPDAIAYIKDRAFHIVLSKF